MSDHLPECLLSDSPPYGWRCICDRLRAYEQRVLEDERPDPESAEADAYDHGYAAGLRDAATAARKQRSKFKARDWDDAIDAALAAIDALRATNP